MPIIAKTSTVLSILVLLTFACDKKESSGGAAAAAAAPTPGPVKYTTGLPEYAGAYDGTKAVAYTSSEMSIFVPRDCPSFSCADVKSGASLDKDKLKTTCPKGQFMIINLKPPTAVGKVQASSIVHTNATGANGLMLDSSDVEILALTPSLVAKVNAKGSESLEGVVGATVCPMK